MPSGAPSTLPSAGPSRSPSPSPSPTPLAFAIASARVQPCHAPEKPILAHKNRTQRSIPIQPDGQRRSQTRQRAPPAQKRPAPGRPGRQRKLRARRLRQQQILQQNALARTIDPHRALARRGQLQRIRSGRLENIRKNLAAQKRQKIQPEAANQHQRPGAKPRKTPPRKHTHWPSPTVRHNPADIPGRNTRGTPGTQNHHLSRSAAQKPHRATNASSGNTASQAGHQPEANPLAGNNLNTVSGQSIAAIHGPMRFYIFFVPQTGRNVKGNYCETGKRQGGVMRAAENRQTEHCKRHTRTRKRKARRRKDLREMREHRKAAGQ